MRFLTGLSRILFLPVIFSATIAAAGSSPFEEKSCQTWEEIPYHIFVAPHDPRLVIDGSAVENINERFCVHHVTDGTTVLSDGTTPLRDEFFVQKDLMVAFADNFNSIPFDGATFDEAQIACDALTLYGSQKGSWRAAASRHTMAYPRELDAKKSIESIGMYIRAIDNDYLSTWSSSSFQDPNSVDAFLFKSRLAIVQDFPKRGRRGVTCISTGSSYPQ
jgi:hypothetical protein